FELDPSRVAPSQSACSVHSTQGLDAGLLVDTEHGGIGGWAEVKLTNSCGFCIKIRVRRIQPITHSVGFERHGSEKSTDGCGTHFPPVSCRQKARQLSDGPAGKRNPEFFWGLHDERCHL